MPSDMSSSRPAAFSLRSRLEREVLRKDAVHRTPGDFEQRAQSGRTATGANAAQPLRDEDAIVDVQRHHVGHGAERHQVEQVRGIHVGIRRHDACLAHPPGQCRHHVERDTDPGQRLRGEALARQVGIDDGRGLRQRVAGQVMVRDQDLDAGAIRLGHAFQR